MSGSDAGEGRLGEREGWRGGAGARGEQEQQKQEEEQEEEGRDFSPVEALKEGSGDEICKTREGGKIVVTVQDKDRRLSCESE